MFPKSIKWRLQLWHGLTLVTVLWGFGFTAFRLQHANEWRRMDQELDQHAGEILKRLGDRRPPGRPPPPEEEGVSGSPAPRPPRPGLRNRSESNDLFGEGEKYYAILWRRDGQVIQRSANAPETLPIPPAPSPGASARGVRDRGVFREIYQFTPPGDCLLVGRPMVAEQAGLRRFALGLTGLGAAVLALGLAGGWWIASRAIRPIRDISATASRIATGDLSQRIPAADSENELGQLTAVLNSTFARLEASFAQQAQFTADASHELRTPVSVILSQTQSALAHE